MGGDIFSLQKILGHSSLASVRIYLNLFVTILRFIGDAGIQGGGFAISFWDATQWMGITTGIKQWSGYILTTAMAGVGLGTSFRRMKGLGIKPFCVGLFAATMVGVTAVVMVFLLGRFVTV